MSTEFEGKYVSVTSYRGDGTAVATPVWFVAENGHLLIETDAGSYKVKRIRRNANVTVAPCTASGRLLGEPVPARAELLPESEQPRVQQLIRRRYRIDWFVVLPVYRVVQRLRGRSTRSRERPVAISITPT